MRRYVTYDKSKHPIVVCTIADFDPTIEEFEAYQKEEAELISQPGIVQIFDMTNMRMLRAEIRIKQGEWVKKYKDVSKKNVLGIAFFSPTILGNLTLKGIFLVSTPFVDYKIVKTMDEAFEFAHQKLKEAR